MWSPTSHSLCSWESWFLRGYVACAKLVTMVLNLASKPRCGIRVWCLSHPGLEVRAKPQFQVSPKPCLKQTNKQKLKYHGSLTDPERQGESTRNYESTEHCIYWETMVYHHVWMSWWQNRSVWETRWIMDHSPAIYDMLSVSWLSHLDWILESSQYPMKLHSFARQLKPSLLISFNPQWVFMTELLAPEKNIFIMETLTQSGFNDTESWHCQHFTEISVVGTSAKIQLASSCMKMHLPCQTLIFFRQHCGLMQDQHKCQQERSGMWWCKLPWSQPLEFIVCPQRTESHPKTSYMAICVSKNYLQLKKNTECTRNSTRVVVPVQPRGGVKWVASDNWWVQAVPVPTGTSAAASPSPHLPPYHLLLILPLYVLKQRAGWNKKARRSTVPIIFSWLSCPSAALPPCRVAKRREFSISKHTD